MDSQSHRLLRHNVLGPVNVPFQEVNIGVIIFAVCIMCIIVAASMRIMHRHGYKEEVWKHHESLINSCNTCEFGIRQRKALQL